ncbi:hypothetical protein PSEUDO8O_120519 [Pseudomonas sp. 8O]|nr:hypothetical protein PSEUDO8O_120519 [Pseudomonas sp. 8O]
MSACSALRVWLRNLLCRCLSSSNTLAHFGGQCQHNACGPHHYHEVDDLAVIIELNKIDTHYLLITDACTELKNIAGRTAEVAEILEILKHAKYCGQDCLHWAFALVGLERRRVAENNIVSE